VALSQNPEMTWTLNGAAHRYTLTPWDIETLARAVAREGAPAREVAWALIQRFAQVHGRGFSTLGKLVQAYAQPINPRWFLDGDKHLAEIARLQTADLTETEKASRIADENARARRRKGYARAPWESLPEETRRMVLELVAGDVPSLHPSVVHYRASKAPSGATPDAAKAAAREFASHRGDLEVADVGAGFGRGVNWFFTSPGVVIEGIRVGPGVPLAKGDSCP